MQISLQICIYFKKCRNMQIYAIITFYPTVLLPKKHRISRFQPHIPHVPKICIYAKVTTLLIIILK